MNVFETVAFFTTGIGMSPAASWALMALILVMAILLVLFVVVTGKLVNLAIYNAKIAGPIGIWWALLGSEAYEIKKEVVVDVARRRDGYYSVYTTYGEEQEEYVIVPLDTDDSEDYQLAKELSGNNRELFDDLCPDSRVRGTFKLRDNRKGKTTVYYLVFLRYFDEDEVEETMQRYFDERYRKECQDASRSRS